MDVEFLVSLYISPSTTSSVTNSQIAHRIHIVRDIWAIPEGSRVLEIGPGQGDCTLVLAAAVGESGHVDAVDPCDLDYGAPYTVGACQSHILTTALGSRISFIQSHPLPHLQRKPASNYTHIVFFNSLWYFDTTSSIKDLLHHLCYRKTEGPKILIAEWALLAKGMEEVPHVLTSLLRAQAEARKQVSTSNIRSAVSPNFLKKLIAADGLVPAKEELVVPPVGLLDGKWEVESVLKEEFKTKVGRRFEGDEKGWAAWENGWDALSAAVTEVGGLKKVRSMQVWVAEF